MRIKKIRNKLRNKIWIKRKLKYFIEYEEYCLSRPMNNYADTHAYERAARHIIFLEKF